MKSLFYAFATLALTACATTPDDLRADGAKRAASYAGEAMPLARCFALALESASPDSVNALREIPPGYAMVTMRQQETGMLLTMVEVRQRGQAADVVVYNQLGRWLPEREAAYLDRLDAALRGCAAPVKAVER